MVKDKKLKKLEKELKKLKSKGFLSKKILSKPTAKLPSTNPKKFITRGLGNQPLVKEGKIGYFNEEYQEEIKWLS